MKIGEIFDMLKSLQHGEHHGDCDHHHKYGQYGGHGHDKHGHHNCHENYYAGHQAKYESHYKSQMEFCSKCGMAISSDHKFCPSCGVDCKNYFECKSCHAKARPGDAFCSQCGCKI